MHVDTPLHRKVAEMHCPFEHLNWLAVQTTLSKNNNYMYLHISNEEKYITIENNMTVNILNRVRVKLISR